MTQDAADQADRSAIAPEELAKMAERAAHEAAKTARRAADVAAAHASDTRSTRLENANEGAHATEDDEAAAREAYHHAEKEARDRLDRS
jgi:predicted Zn-dependent protease